MKIAISVVEPSLDGEVYPRFGRSQYFIIVDPETMQFESVTNPNIEAPSGAGISTAQLIYNKGASAVITGSIGPKAHQALAAAGVRMLTGVSGSIREAIASFKAGKLLDNADAGANAGIEGGAGMGRGSGMGGGGGGRGMGGGGGMGRGMGCGGGKGMGMGAGRGGGAGRVAPRKGDAEPWSDSVRQAGGPDELSSLKQQAKRNEELAWQAPQNKAKLPISNVVSYLRMERAFLRPWKASGYRKARAPGNSQRLSENTFDDADNHRIPPSRGDKGGCQGSDSIQTPPLPPLKGGIFRQPLGDIVLHHEKSLAGLEDPQDFP